MSLLDFFTKQSPTEWLTKQLTPKSSGMRFNVGEGLSQQQTQQAQQTVRKPVTPVAPNPFDNIKNWVVKSITPPVEDFAKIGKAIPQATQPITNAISSYGKGVGDITMGILQGTARSGGSVGATLMGQKEVPVEDKYSQLLFGKGNIESLGTRIEKFPQRAGEVGIPENISKPLAPFAILGITALDFTGAGGSKTVTKMIAKSKKASEIAGVLKKIGVADDLIDDYAEVLVKVTKESEVAKVLNHIDEIQKTTKTTKPFNVLDDMAIKSDPLVQEAKKYKSAEEFVKGQGETLYHGTPAKFETKDFKGGYLTADKKYADVYQSKSASSISYGSEGIKNKASGEPRTLEFVLPKNARLFDNTKLADRKLLNDYWGKSSMSREYSPTKSGQLDWTEGENLAEYLREKGYKFDGIKLDEAGGFDPISGMEVKRHPSVLILNPKVLKTKSQLTDIWKKANKTALPLKKIDPLIQEAKIFNPEKYVAEQVSKQNIARKSETLGIVGKTKSILNEIKIKLVDSNAPIEDVISKFQKTTKSEILPKYDITNQIDRVYRAPTIAGQFVRDNGLEDVIKNVDNLDNLDQYLVAKQAKTVSANGIETGRDLIKDQKLIDAFAPKYEKTAQKVNQYSRNLLDYSVESGLIDKKIANELKIKYPDYVPINRIFNELEKTGEFRGSGAVASLSKQTVIQKLKGSKREIESPIASLLAKTNDAFVQGEKNKAAQILSSYEKLPGNPFEITPLRTAENVKKRIDIFTELGESKLIKDKLQRLIVTRNRWTRSLQSELNQLNKEGIKQYLKRKPEKVVQKTSKLQLRTSYGSAKATETSGQDFIVTGIKSKEYKTIPVEFSNKEVRDMVNSLINETPEKINIIKQKIGTRDKHLSGVLDELSSLLGRLSEVKTQRAELFDEAKLIRDAESRGKATISVLRDGIKEIYETTPEIAQAAKSLSVQQLNILGKIFALPVRVARVGITGINLPFVASNIAKDQVTAIINSKNALKTSIANPLNFVRALYEAVGHGKLYQEAVRSGAMGTTFDISRNQAPKTIAKIRASKNVGSRILYTVKNPSELLRAVENIIGRSEELTRIQQYGGTKQAMLKKGMTETDAIISASKAARENTVNFARRGEWGTVLNSTFLYMNAGIQGTRTFLRGLKNRPVQTTAKLATTVFTPIAAVTLWNLNDPKRKAAYEDIAEYEKENNIVIIPPDPTQDENGNWNVIKIPLSQEVNNIANLARRPIEQSFGLDPVRAAEVAQAFIGSVLPINMNKDIVSTAANTFVPQAIKPTLEMYTNKKFFTGFSQIPESMKNLSPELQVKKNTSGTARKIGNALNTSPIQVEEFIKGTAGGVAVQGLHASDLVLAGLKIIPEDQIGGQNVIEAIMARFDTARGGQIDEKSNNQLKKILTGQADERFRTKQEAEILFEELKKLPKEEANAKANEIKKKNPQLFEKLKDTVEADEKGLDYNDRLILQLGVENGERAKFVWENLKAFKTKEEKNNYVNEMRKKGIISDNVMKQLMQLKDRGY